MPAAGFRSLLFISCCLLLVGCQGSPDAPAGPRDLAGAAVCKSNAFTNASAIYTNNQTRNDKLAQCKDILAAVNNGNASAAETGINGLLVGLSQDSQACLDTDTLTACVLNETSLAQKVSAFAQATCGLFPALGDEECLVPTADDVTSGGWVAATALEDSIVSLPNDSVAVQIDDLKSEFETGGIFVAIRDNDATALLGPCPGTFANDCEQQNVQIDTDPEGAFETDGLYVEICEDELFAASLASCEDGACNAGTPVEPPREILSCTLGGKFSATSTFVGTDDEARVRDVLCNVSSKSAGVSTGTLCQLYTPPLSNPSNLVGTCTTVATGQKTASCLIDPPAEVPDSTNFLLTGSKVVGTGSHFGQTTFFMSPGNPPRGVTRTVNLILKPSGQN